MMLEPEPEVEDRSVDIVALRRVRRPCGLQSAAGPLRFPVVRAGSVLPSPSSNIVKLANGETTELPEQNRMPDEPVVGPREGGKNMEIDDVTTFSKNAVRAEVPPVQILASQNDEEVDGFYGKSAPFSTPPSLKSVGIPLMSHPLMQRKKIVHPKVTLLGVPEEW